MQHPQLVKDLSAAPVATEDDDLGAKLRGGEVRSWVRDRSLHSWLCPGTRLTAVHPDIAESQPLVQTSVDKKMLVIQLDSDEKGSGSLSSSASMQLPGDHEGEACSDLVPVIINGTLAAKTCRSISYQITYYKMQQGVEQSHYHIRG